MAGNLIDDGRYRFRYDGFSRLTRVTDSQTGKDVLSQSYDPLGRVTQRSADGAEETMVWDGAELIFRQTVTGGQVGGTTSTQTFIPGLAIDEPLAELDSQGTHFLHPDPTSSVIAVSDSHGKITERFHYRAFGEAAGTFDAAFKPTLSFSNSRARFQGREQLGSLPYLDFRSRAYSPQHGRFLQTDPIGLAGDPNQYRFARNNPLSFMDPMGTDPVQRGMGGGGGSFNPDADLSRFMNRPTWGKSFLEGLMAVACPFLAAAATLQQLNSRAMAANRSGASRSYGNELFDVAKMVPILGGLLGLGELGVHAAQGKPAPEGLLPKLLGGLVGGLFMGGAGIGSWRLTTPKVGGYGYAFKHAAFLNRLRMKGLRRLHGRLARARVAIQKIQDLMNSNPAPLPSRPKTEIAARGVNSAHPVPDSKVARALATIDPFFIKEMAAMAARKIAVILDDGPPPKFGQRGRFQTVPGGGGLAGVNTVYLRSLYSTAEATQTFVSRIVATIAHEGWHVRQFLDFNRVANRLDELLAIERQYRVLNRQNSGQSSLGPKPPFEWYHERWETMRGSSAYGHLPGGVPPQK